MNNIHQIDNYPGLPHVSGPDLAMSFFNQATDLGVEVEYGDVQRVEKEGDVFVVSGDFGELRSKTVLVQRFLLEPNFCCEKSALMR